MTKRGPTKRTTLRMPASFSEHWADELMRYSTDVVIVLADDRTIRFTAEPVRHVLGYAPIDLLGSDALELVHADDRAGFSDALAACLRTPDGRAAADLRVRRADSNDLDVEAILVNRLADEVVQGVVMTVRDISERKRFEQALRDSEERYALAARGANDGLWDWDLRRGRVHYSPRWKQMLGCAEGEVGDDPREWLGRVHPDDAARVEREIADHLTGRTEHFESEHRLLHRDGSYRWMLVRGLAVRSPNGQATRFAGSQGDITERKVYHPLTRLPNRVLLADRVARALARWRQDPEARLGLLFLDLDRFKGVNESFGHGVGDLLLMAVAERVEAAAPRTATVAHVGGDQFAMLVEDIAGPAQATRIAREVLERLGAPFPMGKQELFVAASIGIALGSPGHRRAEDLVRDAEAAMHRAKSEGGGRYELFDLEMHRQARARMQLEGELRRALARDELRVVYQPIVALAGGRAVGFEALARWHHPERGVLPPMMFVPLAEETGLVHEIGRLVLAQATRQARAWREAGAEGLTVAVNLSGKQFSRPDLAAEIAEALEQSGLAGPGLRLEITETALMGNPDAAARTLHRLKERGVKLAIDDFGTGYSSLSYLHRFPFDTIKIDRSFVEGLGVDSAHRAIVRTIVALAGTLGMEVVAEGVDSAEQAAELQALGCGFGQGFYFARPVEADGVPALIASPPRAGEERREAG